MDTKSASGGITLYGVGYSPWTERARWALDHHRIAYRYREHLPMLGEPMLRRRARAAGQAKPTAPQPACSPIWLQAAARWRSWRKTGY